MVNQTIVNYINTYKDQYPMAQLKQALKKQGFSDAQIAEAEKPAAQAPPPPGAGPAQPGFAPAQDNVLGTAEQEGIKQINGVTYIAARLAAIEVYNWVKKIKLIAGIEIAAPLLSIIVYMFHPGAGTAMAGVMAAAGIYFIFTGQREQKRLEARYQINPKRY